MNKLFILLLFLNVSLWAVDAKPWLRHPAKDSPHEDKFGAIITFYWTFDPENADEGWDGWSKWEGPQDPVHLQGTDITVPRNMAEKFNLEGSGWYTEDGGHRVVNIMHPHAEPDSTLFIEVPYVDYGLDAAHQGLVPFRTVAGVHQYVPAGTWVYIPMFDGIEVPVYDLDDRTQLAYSYWHDGWFRVTDISWSFADDQTQLDIFGGTVQAISEVYGMIWDNFSKTGIWNETKQEYQTLDTYQDNISFYYNSDVAVFGSENENAVYRYFETTDTVHHDTDPKDFKVAEGFSRKIRIVCGDFEADGLRNDGIIFDPEANTLAAFLNITETTVSPSTSAEATFDLGVNVVNDLMVGDFTNTGNEGILVATSTGIWGAKTISSPFIQMSSEVADLIKVGDIDNDDNNDIIICSGSEFKTAVFENGKIGAFTVVPVPAASSISSFTMGDLTAEGQDEIVYGTEQGIYSYNFTGGVSKLFSDEIPSPKVLHTMYMDTDGFADIYTIHNDSVKVKYSSHKEDASFFPLCPTTSDWLTSATIDGRVMGTPTSVSGNKISVSKQVSSELTLQGNTLSINANVSQKMRVFSLNGRKLAEINPVSSNGKASFNLNSLRSLGNQVFVCSINTENGIVSKMITMK